MTKIVELRQDRTLISKNFDGYKLCLDAVPILKQEVSREPFRAEPNEEQYSLLHVQLFSMQNHLQADPWLKTNAFYVNQLGEIIKCSYNVLTGRPEPLEMVFQMDSSNLFKNENRVKGDYNYTFRFISEKYCVVCDGIKSLILLDTGDRQKSHPWKIVKEDVIQFEDAEIRNFLIYDCRLDTIQERKQISIALGHVDRVDLADEGVNHFMNLYWAQWILKEDWVLEIPDYLRSKGSIYYCSFEPRGASLLLCSNRDFHFNSKKVEKKEESLEQAEKPQLHDEVTYNYSWSQTDEEIVLKLNESEAEDVKKFQIKTTVNNLNVKLEEMALIDINFFDEVDPDLTTWTLENKFLQITLPKKASGVRWLSITKEGEGPKEDTANSSGPLPVEQQPIANLEAPIEDCDFPIGTLEDDVKLERFHLPKKEITHTIIMGSNPPLFSTNLRPGFPNAIATRVDVDACLWLLQYNPTKPDDWIFRHEGNLHAFGYVQASKEQKKFMNCSPDLSYAVICESHRHLFLYKTKHDNANGLRNRNGPQVNLGKQYLIELNDVGEVLGMTTAPNVLTLLTDKYVLYIQIN